MKFKTLLTLASVIGVSMVGCMPRNGANIPTQSLVLITPTTQSFLQDKTATSVLPTSTPPSDAPTSDIKSLVLAIAPHAEAVVLYGIPHPVPYAPPSWEIMYLPVSAEGEPLSPPQIWFETNNFSRLLLSPNRQYLAIVYEDEWGSFGKILDLATGELLETTLDLAETRFEGWASNSNGTLNTFDSGRGLALNGQDSQILIDNINNPGAQITAAALSPDGKNVMYASSNKIWVMDRETSERHQIINDPNFNLQVDFLSWSPDGNWVALHSQQGLSLMKPDGANLISFVDNLCNVENYYPEWNSFGTGVVCEHSLPERVVKFPFNKLGYVVQMNSSGGFHVRQVEPETTGVFFNPSWLPDGESFLTIGWMPGDRLDIFMVKGSGEIKPLTFDGERKHYPIWFDLSNEN